MPDQRPSHAPLTESEADRLSERFTASWEDPDLTAEPGSAAKSSPAATESASTTAPLPAVAPGKPQPTLLGIAPIVVGPSAPPPAPPTPLPAPPARPLTASPEAAAVASETTPPPPPSAPDSSVTRGLTTPSKPYIPKDDPSTPAVVISEAALRPSAEPPVDRTRRAPTIPGQTRSSPIAAPIALIPTAAAEVDETYPALRRGRSKLPLFVGGMALLGVAALAFVKLKGSAPRAADASAPPPTLSAAAAPQPSPVAEPEAPPSPATVSSPAAVEPSQAPPPGPAEPRVSKVLAKKTSSSLSATRKAPKSEGKPNAKAPASEPAPARKGVIVRETPF